MKNFRNNAGKLVAGAGTFFASTYAMAIDTTAIQTAITAAETDALTTGEYVIAIVKKI